MTTSATQRRVTAEAIKLAKEKEVKKLRTAALLRKDFDETFSTPCGKRVLRWLFDQSGFDQSDVTADPRSGELNVKSTWYNQAYRNFYLKIRRMITRKDILIDVEFRGLESDEPN